MSTPSALCACYALRLRCPWRCAVPINFHIGNMGVASAYNDTVDSVPPAMHGGNVDDRRIGKGASMYYPVQVRARGLRGHAEQCLRVALLPVCAQPL